MNDLSRSPMSSFTITCTEDVKHDSVNEFVYEAFGKFDALNKEKKFTYKEYSFPDEEIISAISSFFKQCNFPQTITCVMEFDHLNNRVEVFTRYCKDILVPPQYKAVKIFSGRWLKEPKFKG